MTLYPLESKDAIRWLPKNPVAPVKAIVGIFSADKIAGFNL